MTQTLTAKEQPLSKIFSDEYVFSIPGYQRPYSWGTEQAQELLDDLLGYMQDSKVDVAHMPPYFLGSIVLIKPDASTRAEVVDGQQRLTTLTLLLSAIRATVVDTEVQAGITTCLYEKGNKVLNTAPLYRLSLRDRDNEFFRQYVQGDDGIAKLAELNNKLADPQDRLRSNARIFLERLDRLDQDSLAKLAQFIATRCYLVTVATPDLDSAYRIFGVLNSRGLDLSATDILKANILGDITDVAQRTTCTKKWDDIEEELGREPFNELFGHIRTAYSKTKPKGTLLKEFRDFVGPKNPATFIDEVLAPMAGAFKQITGADYSSQKNAEVINTTLRWMNRIEFKDWLPPALAFFIRHHNDPTAMLSFFIDLERLGYSMLIRRTGINERIDRFGKLSAAIERGEDLTASDSPIQLTDKEQFETYRALSGPVYETYSARTLAVILVRLDGLLASAGATYDLDITTIEHVLPQNPKAGTEWLTWFPTESERDYWVHRLGNLALLSRKKNSSASNWDFERKKSAYFVKNGVSPFAVTTEVLQHTAWTRAVVEDRQQSLLSKLESHWRLEGRRSVVEQPTAAPNTTPGAVTNLELVDQKGQISAKAVECDGQLTVLTGAKARPDWTGAEHGYKAVRQDLIDNGSLKTATDGNLEFTKDVTFSSPSAASAVILGRSDNGRNSWIVTETGQSYGEWKTDPIPPGPSKTGQRQEALKRFWTQFIERSKAITDLYAGRNPTYDHWLSGGLRRAGSNGRSGFEISVVVTKDTGRVECFMRLPNDDGTRTTQAFEQLKTRQSLIETSFGAPLQWDPMPGKKGAKIYLEVTGGLELDEAQWPNFQDHLASKAERLAAALSQPIQDLQLS